MHLLFCIFIYKITINVFCTGNLLWRVHLSGSLPCCSVCNFDYVFVCMLLVTNKLYLTLSTKHNHYDQFNVKQRKGYWWLGLVESFRQQLQHHFLIWFLQRSSKQRLFPCFLIRTTSPAIKMSNLVMNCHMHNCLTLTIHVNSVGMLFHFPQHAHK